jgi:DNA-binding NarL/FixJ family response regulator
VDEFRNCFLYENIVETNPQFQAIELAIARMWGKLNQSPTLRLRLKSKLSSDYQGVYEIRKNILVCVLGWVSEGKTNKEIGVILELSPRTVPPYRERISLV